jgi:transposase
MGRSRGGLTSKIHVVVDGNGLPVRLGLTGGQAHDNRLCSVLLRQLPRHARLLADRGYDADWIRAFVSERGAWANIPPKRNRKDPICFSPYLYRDRNLVERFFNKIKQCRRVATRYDKLAANYLAFIKLACIRLWLRVYECTALLKRFDLGHKCIQGLLFRLGAFLPNPPLWSVIRPTGLPGPSSMDSTLGNFKRIGLASQT